MIYIIQNCTNKKTIGSDYPQCISLIKNYDVTEFNSITNFSSYKGKKVAFIPNLDGLKLDLKAKLTDFISCGLGPGNDSIISHNFFKILEKSVTSSFQQFNCSLYQNDEAMEYVWLHYIYTLENKVDFAKSEFTHVDISLQSHLQKISSYNDFEYFYNTYDEYGLIRAKKTILKSPPLDFFVIGRFNQKHYVSERLKNEMECIGITGIEFEEADDMIFI